MAIIMIGKIENKTYIDVEYNSIFLNEICSNDVLMEISTIADIVIIIKI